MLTMERNLSRISSSDTFLLRLTVIPLDGFDEVEFAEADVAIGTPVFLFLSDTAVNFTFPLTFLVILSEISSFSTGFVY